MSTIAQATVRAQVTLPVVTPAYALDRAMAFPEPMAPARPRGRRAAGPVSLAAEIWAAGFHKPLRGRGRHVAEGTR